MTFNEATGIPPHADRLTMRLVLRSSISRLPSLNCRMCRVELAGWADDTRPDLQGCWMCRQPAAASASKSMSLVAAAAR